MLTNIFTTRLSTDLLAGHAAGPRTRRRSRPRAWRPPTAARASWPCGGRSGRGIFCRLSDGSVDILWPAKHRKYWICTILDLHSNIALFWKVWGIVFSIFKPQEKFEKWVSGLAMMQTMCNYCSVGVCKKSLQSFAMLRWSVCEVQRTSYCSQETRPAAGQTPARGTWTGSPPPF